MYTSDRCEVYNYMGVKLTRCRSITTFCLLVTFEAQVRLRRCVNFYVLRNQTGKFCLQQSEVLSTLGQRIARFVAKQTGALRGGNPRYRGIWPKSDICNVGANEF